MIFHLRLKPVRWSHFWDQMVREKQLHSKCFQAFSIRHLGKFLCWDLLLGIARLHSKNKSHLLWVKKISSGGIYHRLILFYSTKIFIIFRPNNTTLLLKN